MPPTKNPARRRVFCSTVAQASVDIERGAGLLATALIRRLVTGLAAVALDHHAAQVVGGEDQRGADRLAGRRLVLARQRAAETAAIQADAHAATLRPAL